MPAFEQARLEAQDLTDLAPVEYRADAVVVLAAGTEPVLAVFVVIREAQLRRDGAKRWSWPVVPDLTLRARLRCPAVLAGRLCRRFRGRRGRPGRRSSWGTPPRAIGSSLLVLGTGPEYRTDHLTRWNAGRAPELAVLSAMAHGFRPRTGPRCWTRSWARSWPSMGTTPRCTLMSFCRLVRRSSRVVVDAG